MNLQSGKKSSSLQLLSSFILSFISFCLFFVTPNAKAEDSIGVMDGLRARCIEQADLGSPSIVIDKVGQSKVDDGIEVEFEIRHFICGMRDGRLVRTPHVPLSKISNSAALSDYSLILTVENQDGSDTVISTQALPMNEKTSRIKVILPRKLSGSSIDSSVQVMISDFLGSSLTSFGRFRHNIR